MAKTQAEVEYQIRNKLFSLNLNRYDSRSIRTWINDGVSDVARKTEALRATASVAITAGTESVSAPNNCVRVHMVLYTPTSDPNRRYDLEYRDIKNLSSMGWGQADTQNRPVLFHTWGYPPNLTIGVYPKPSEGGTLDVRYYRLPVALATTTDADAGTVIDMVDGWEDLVVNFAVKEALLSDGDPRWQAYQSQYKEDIDALAEAAIRYTDQAGAYDTGNSLVPQWLWEMED